MGKKSSYVIGVAILIIWPLSTSCVYLDKVGHSFYGNQDEPESRYFEELVRKSLEQLEEDRGKENDKDGGFNYMMAEKGKLRFLGFDASEASEAIEGELLLRFVWFSDVHIRQRELKVGSKWYSKLVDRVFAPAERNSVQEDFHWAVYLSQVAATNRLHRDLKETTEKKDKGPVDFMIHTGDAVDIGTIEELYQFIHISNQLEIPWLNVVGNHDVTILGNYMSRLGYGRHLNATIYPIGNLGDFIWMHRKKSAVSGVGRFLLPVPEDSKCQVSVMWDQSKLLPSSHHGFDLTVRCGKNGDGCNDLSRGSKYDSAGDYATDLKVEDTQIRLIVLNSSKKDGMGYGGSMSGTQRRWLEGILAPAGDGSTRDRINLVFAHHPSKDYGDDILAVLNNTGNGPIVLFTGHDHKNRLYEPSASTRGGYYELNTGSAVQHPQIGRLIELRKSVKNGKIYLISRALWNSYMEIAEEKIKEVLEGCAGAERNAKMEHIREAVHCGHYGAYADYRENKCKWRFFSPQIIDQKMWDAVNVIIPIYSPAVPVEAVPQNR